MSGYCESPYHQSDQEDIHRTGASSQNRLLLQRGVPHGAGPPERRIHYDFTRIGRHSSLDKELYQQQEGPEEEEVLTNPTSLKLNHYSTCTIL